MRCSACRYYNPNDIKRDFGTIENYQAPKARHPSSIMSVSNTGGHGRGGQGGKIIGDVINHGAEPTKELLLRATKHTWRVASCC